MGGLCLTFGKGERKELARQFLADESFPRVDSLVLYTLHCCIDVDETSGCQLCLLVRGYVHIKYILEHKKVKRERRIMYHIYQQLLPHHSCSGTE